MSASPLEDALVVLRLEFPDAQLFDVRLKFRRGERKDHPHIQLDREWNDVSWEIQVNNDSAYGDTVDEAIQKLREKIEWSNQVQAKAEAIAALLREIPIEGFRRNDVLFAAQRILENEGSHR